MAGTRTTFTTYQIAPHQSLLMEAERRVAPPGLATASITDVSNADCRVQQ